MKILLVQPSIPRISKGVSGTINLEPLALELIAAPLISEHDVRILDLKIEDRLHETLVDFRPDLVGISAYTMEVPQAIRCAHEIKKFSPEITTVIGGLHATLFPRDFVDTPFDFLIRGRGEVTFRQFVQDRVHHKNIQDNQKIFDLRRIPETIEFPVELWKPLSERIFPARNLVEKYRHLYHLGLMDHCYSLKTSDGCPYRCSFCLVWRYYQGKYYARAAADVVAEIESIPGSNIIVVDDNFFFNPKRSFEIAHLLRVKKIYKNYYIQSRPDSIVRYPELVSQWRDIGLTMVALGMDGFRQRELEDWSKQSAPELGKEASALLDSLGVQSLGEFIIDTDYSLADFRDLRRYIVSTKLTLIQLSILTPLPGTTLYEQKKDELITDDLEKINIDYPITRTRLPLWQFFNAIANLYWLVYSYPGGIIRRIRLGHYSVLKSLKGFSLIFSLVYHYKMQSWRAFFNRDPK